LAKGERCGGSWGHAPVVAFGSGVLPWMLGLDLTSTNERAIISVLGALVWGWFVWSPFVLGGLAGGVLLDAGLERVLQSVRLGRGGRVGSPVPAPVRFDSRNVETAGSGQAVVRTSLVTVRRVGASGTVCGRCGERVERTDGTALRLTSGWWHRACWLAESEDRRPVLEAERDRNSDVHIVAAFLRRGLGQGFRNAVLGDGPGSDAHANSPLR
jgi:hypothetical protein